jgi:hypothetical protein
MARPCLVAVETPVGAQAEEKRARRALRAAVMRVQEASEFLAGDSAEPQWQIEEVVPRVGVGLTYGSSKSFKSFSIIDKAACIHLGRPWGERTVRKGRSVILVAEGVHGFRNRMLAYAKFYGIDQASMPAVIPYAPNLFNGDVEPLIESLSVLGVTYLAIDTQSQVTTGADESNTKDMNIVFGAYGRIAAALQCFVEPISHTGHNDQGHARGSSVQRPACDVEIYHERAAGEMIATATIRKLKDADDTNVAFTYKLHVVQLGVYAKSGKPYSSLALEHIPTGATPQKRTKERGLRSKEQRQFLEALRIRAKSEPGRAWSLADLRQIGRKESGLSKCTARNVVKVVIGSPHMRLAAGGYILTDGEGRNGTNWDEKPNEVASTHSPYPPKQIDPSKEICRFRAPHIPRQPMSISPGDTI